MDDSHLDRLKEGALNGPGDTDGELRQRIWDFASARSGGPESDADLAEPLRRFVDTVALRAAETDDALVETMREAGFSDDALFEVTVVAAVSAGMARLERALRAQKGEES